MKESVIRAVIQLGFSTSEAARRFHVSEMGAKIIDVREFLAEKLEGKFQHQNRTAG